MSEQPQKRPWFQYHLSTAIVLMFVAAGLLWVNMNLPLGGTSYACGKHICCKSTGYGFPCPFWERGYETRYTGPAEAEVRTQTLYSQFYLGCLIVNIVFAGLILVGVAILCERPIRRKDRLREQQ